MVTTSESYFKFFMLFLFTFMSLFCLFFFFLYSNCRSWCCWWFWTASVSSHQVNYSSDCCNKLPKCMILEKMAQQLLDNIWLWSRVTRPRRTGIFTRHDLTKIISAENPSKATTTSLRCSFRWALISAGMQSQELRTVARRELKAVAVVLSSKSKYAWKQIPRATSSLPKKRAAIRLQIL